MAALSPILTEQWHPTLNGKISPKDVTIGSSSRKYWWQCPVAEDHIYEAKVNNRKQGEGCPICAGKKVVQSNSLATINPELAKEWHPTLNGNITSSDITVSANKKIWWKCDKGEDHILKSLVSSRTVGRGCPICRGLKVVESNCLRTVSPKLSLEWHSTLNGDLTPDDVSAGSKKRVWWQCSKGEDHIWAAPISERSSGHGCAICRGLKVVKSNSLAYLQPELTKEWHPSLNGKLTPYDVTLKSHKQVWWKCDKGDDHEWKASIDSRTRGNGCPICSGRKVVKSNSLATLNPKLASEWHPTLNGNITPNTVALSSSTKKYWWQCSKGKDHVWLASPNSRSSKESGCPYCTLTPQSRQELTITFELASIFKDIDPKGHKIRVKGTVHSIDIYIPLLNMGIEFDGHYWHKGKRDFDKVKTLKLEQAGLNIIRVREEPLKKIFGSDIISKKPYNGKEITNNLLEYFKTVHDFDKGTLNRINKYLSKEELQNQKGLEKYIDFILEEKAKKRSVETIELTS